MDTSHQHQEEESIDPNETLTSERLNALATILNTSTNVNVIENNLFHTTPKLNSPLGTNINICTNNLNVTNESLNNYNLTPIVNTNRIQPSTSKSVIEFDRKDLKNIIQQTNIYEKDIPNPASVNIASSGIGKWSTNKEKFLENKHYEKVDNIVFGKNLNTNSEKKVEKESELTKVKPGAVIVKESYIEPPRISRVSRSFHGKSSNSGSFLDISAIPRRASDSPRSEKRDIPISLQEIQWGNTDNAKVIKKHPFLTQLSQPSGSATHELRKPSLPDSVSVLFLSFFKKYRT